MRKRARVSLTFVLRAVYHVVIVVVQVVVFVIIVFIIGGHSLVGLIDDQFVVKWVQRETPTGGQDKADAT